MPKYYKSLLTQNMFISKDDSSTIDKDVLRTKGCFKDKDKSQFITNVLRAFAKRNPDIAYLQGFNFIVDFLWQKGFDEESTFWIFCYIAENLILKKYHLNLTLLFVDVKLFKYILYNKNKKLFRKLMKNQIDLFYIIHKWFLVNFLNISNLKVSFILI